MPGQIMIIECDDLQKRENALRQILNNIAVLEKQFDNSKNKDEIELMSFVPEQLVIKEDLFKELKTKQVYL